MLPIWPNESNGDFLIKKSLIFHSYGILLLNPLHNHYLILQMLHHGSTAVHWEADVRSTLVYVRLERSCSLIVWSRPAWSSMRPAAPPDYSLSTNPEEIPPSRWSGTEPSLEEGYLDLTQVKEVVLGPRDKERDDFLNNTLRR